jgi:hypothetical protein
MVKYPLITCAPIRRRRDDTYGPHCLGMCIRITGTSGNRSATLSVSAGLGQTVKLHSGSLLPTLMVVSSGILSSLGIVSTKLPQRTRIALRIVCPTDSTTMSEQIYVKLETNLARNRILNTVLGCVGEPLELDYPESRQNPANVCVYRKDLSSERIHQHTSRSLQTHPR